MRHQPARPPGTLFQEASDLLRTLSSLPEPYAHIGSEAAGRLVWAAGWFGLVWATPPGSIDPPSPKKLVGRLRAAAASLQDLVEHYEEEDPLANADGIQAGSLAFAVVSAAAARLERLVREQGLETAS